MMSNTKRFSPEIRKIAYEAIKSGTSLTEISRNLGIGKSTLSRWKRVGERPADFGRVAPSFRSTRKTSQPEEIYQELFCKLPTLNQEFAEHLIQQYEGGIFFAIEYAKLTLRRITTER